MVCRISSAGCTVWHIYLCIISGSFIYLFLYFELFCSTMFLSSFNKFSFFPEDLVLPFPFIECAVASLEIFPKWWFIKFQYQLPIKHLPPWQTTKLWFFSAKLHFSFTPVKSVWYFCQGDDLVGMMWHCTTCDVLSFLFLNKATCTPVFVGMSTKMTLLLVAKAKQELSIMFFPCSSCQPSEKDA